MNSQHHIFLVHPPTISLSFSLSHLFPGIDTSVSSWTSRESDWQLLEYSRRKSLKVISILLFPDIWGDNFTGRITRPYMLSTTFHEQLLLHFPYMDMVNKEHSWYKKTPNCLYEYKYSVICRQWSTEQLFFSHMD